MPAELTLQQQQAFEQFSRLKVGALFMKQGTGKTRTALELVKYNATKIDLLVWLAPKSAIDVSILPEIDKWGCPVEVLAVGYESLSGSDRIYLETLDKLKDRHVFIVADESIFIKNGMAKRTQRSKELRKLADYALVLNGTPVTRDEWDLYNQMEFLSPHILNMSPGEFRAAFFTEHKRKLDYQKERRWYTFFRPNAAALSAMIEPYVFHCDLDFEHKQHRRTSYVPYQDDAYYLAKNEMLAAIEGDMDYQVICGYLTRMNRIAACYLPKNQTVADAARGRRCLVFCGFIEEADQIATALGDCYVIIGSTNHADRAAVVEAWRHDSKPLVLTYGVGAYSLNLQDGNEIIYSSLTFDYARYDQSQYRIKRLGQKSDITYREILSDVGIQKMIADNLSKKAALSDVVKQHIEDGTVEQWLKST